MKARLIPLGVALLALGACAPESTGERVRPDTASVQSPASESDPADDAWRISPGGVKDIRVGMGFSELAAHLRAAADTAALGEACGYVSVAGAPDSVRFMVEAGRLVRIEVVGGSATTREGARIGDTEERILQLYPAARRMPHKYTAGQYLIALPGAPADTVHRYVFETDGTRVTMFRAGVYPQVEYVEGCS